MASIQFGGYSGIDTQTIVSQLVAAEQTNMTPLNNAKTLATQRQGAWNAIGSDLGSLNSALSILSSASALRAVKTTSSSPDIISVSGSAAAGTSLGLTVSALATSELSSLSGFASTSSDTSGGVFSLAQGARSLGVSSVTASTSGKTSVEVQTKSMAAKIAGTSSPVLLLAPASFTVTTASGPKSVTIPAGTYADADALSSAANAALTTAGSDARAGVENGAFVLKTASQGSNATLRVDGASAALLGLATGTTVTGQDAVLSVGGESVALSDLSAGKQVSLGSSGVSLTIGASGGLDTGSFTVNAISAANVSDLASLINSANAGVSAAVAAGPTGGGQVLLTSRSTGTSGAVAMGWTGSTGALSTLRAGSDAQLQLGSQTITRSSNTISDLIPGATLQLKGTSSSDVVISSDQDVDSAVTKVRNVVNALNTALSTIDATTKPGDGKNSLGGVLNSDSVARSLRREVQAAMTGAMNSGGFKTLSSLGIVLQRSGSYTFDESKFRQNMTTSSSDVVTGLMRTSNSTDARVSYSSASDAAVAGTYDVAITAAAAPAELTGSAFTTLAADESISVQLGAATATYSAHAGQAIDDVVSGINTAATNSKLRLFADVYGGAIRIRTLDAGSTHSLSVTAGAGTGISGTATGTDVAGTIDGQAATGSGRILTSTSGSAKGLALTINAAPSEVAQSATGILSLGTSTYSYGFIDRLSRVISTLRGTQGQVTRAISSSGKGITAAQSRIDAYQRHLTDYEARLRTQYTQLETALSKIKSGAGAAVSNFVNSQNKTSSN